MIPTEGKVAIEISKPGQSGCKVSVVSSRPLLASRLLVNKAPEQVRDTVSLLFSVCRNAQQIAADTALASLEGQISPEKIIKHEIQLLLENAHEHLIRILLDWRSLIEWPNNSIAETLPHYNELRLRIQSEKEQRATDEIIEHLHQLCTQIEILFSEKLVAERLDTWLLRTDLDKIAQWADARKTLPAAAIGQIFDNRWEHQGRCETPLLTSLAFAELARRFERDDVERFVAQPEWDGQAQETSCLARQLDQPLVAASRQQHGNGLLTRCLARITEILRLPTQLRHLLSQLQTPAPQPLGLIGAHQGMAVVATARGLLAHGTAMINAKTNRYHILAPTEWNAHPQGILAQALASLDPPDPAHHRKLAQWLIYNIDPCAACELHYAGH